MDEELISKKDILNITGISYGQLYRWKRKNLIPEEWFIKRSSFTGQETYFPKEKILDRINKIISLKDDMPLDDLANMFSTKIQMDSMNEEKIIEDKLVSKEGLKIYKDIYGEKEVYSFKEVLCMQILEELLHNGEVTIEEGKLVIETIRDNYESLKEKGEVFLGRKLGVSICMGAIDSGELVVDNGIRVIIRLKIPKYIEELKLKGIV